MFNDDVMMATSTSRKHIDLMLKVARAYYLDDKTQSEIAKEIGYSRPTVSRLLKESRESGIVHITIGHTLERMRSLEDGLKRRYGLRHARVAEVRPGEDPRTIVPRYAAALFAETCAPDSLITVSNGNAVAATVREVPVCDWPKSNVAQMLGTLSPDNPMTDSPDICRMLAQRIGGTFTILPAPMILSSPELARAMRQEPQIATALALGGGADVAIVGVGAVTTERSGHIFDAYIDQRKAADLHAHGVVGHICGHHIDAQGRHVTTDLCERTISIDIERLHRIPLVIGVAWGSVKTPAIRACLIGGLISALVTDQSTAEALLA
ncbi:sugar-binding protein [Bifidobacterium callitrichos]|uniref:Sugar-binding protein n=2 Tax=Bifidobacterium callitrichos TaxID=762209 RepID=A0A5M9ZEN7_9BIFI|nr:sugar-binding domain-containing protein [Bifidobacterium callitrichos]KAA8817556.1 sugar-binding protein [Bifidobacterium callitrichos]KFI56441.1 sugar-binding protein [Bifidobacterium callitrichos DSM 23973]